MGYNFGSGSIQDQDLVLAVLEQPTKVIRVRVRHRVI